MGTIWGKRAGGAGEYVRPSGRHQSSCHELRGARVSRRRASITLDNIGALRSRCRRCVFWELDPVGYARAHEEGDPRLEKESWVSSVLLEWGSCGKIVYVDGAAAGYVLYSPPQYVPQSVAFPTSTVYSTADLIITAHILAHFPVVGLGRL